MPMLLQNLASCPIPLPPGREVPFIDGSRPAMLWCSDEPPTADLVQQLRAAHPATGLWPVLLNDDPLELMPELAGSPDLHDAVLVLAGFWHRYTRDGPASTTSPFGQRWPRIAPVGKPREDPLGCADDVTRALLRGGRLVDARLGLVPAGRGADVLANMGWAGPVNYDNDTAKFSAVLRSWEDRFGVRVVAANSNTLIVSVAAPPGDLDAALHLAAEHFAFCPDNLWQSHPHTIGDYAPQRCFGSPDAQP
jgi:hypothetical protein